MSKPDNKQPNIAMPTSISFYAHHRAVLDVVRKQYGGSLSHAVRFIIDQYARDHGIDVEGAKEKKQ